MVSLPSIQGMQIYSIINIQNINHFLNIHIFDADVV